MPYGCGFQHVFGLAPDGEFQFGSSLSNSGETISIENSIGGIVEASVKFRWEKINDSNILGYKIYWRETTSPTWDNSRFVGDVSEATLNGIVIDNFFFGVASIAEDGHESVVVFPSAIFR